MDMIDEGRRHFNSVMTETHLITPSQNSVNKLKMLRKEIALARQELEEMGYVVAYRLDKQAEYVKREVNAQEQMEQQQQELVL